jgi:hypothetical protein
MFKALLLYRREVGKSLSDQCKKQRNNRGRRTVTPAPSATERL